VLEFQLDQNIDIVVVEEVNSKLQGQSKQ